MSLEHRKHPRYPVEIAAELTLGHHVVSAATQNVSEGGVGVLVATPLPDGAEVAVTLFLTQDGIEDPDQEPFEGRATIAWSGPGEGGTHIAGLRFGKIDPTQAAQLRRFLAALAE